MTREMVAAIKNSRQNGGRQPTVPRSVSKVSVAMPNELTESVRERAGPGQFSAYVTSAVQRQLELDKLAELVAEIEERRGGPASEASIREAEATWRPG